MSVLWWFCGDPCGILWATKGTTESFYLMLLLPPQVCAGSPRVPQGPPGCSECSLAQIPVTSSLDLFCLFFGFWFFLVLCRYRLIIFTYPFFAVMISYHSSLHFSTQFLRYFHFLPSKMFLPGGIILGIFNMVILVLTFHWR